MASSILNSDDGVISGTAGLKSVGGDDGTLVFQSKGTETARINTDSQIVAAAGTASLPVITTTGDLNTGIYFPAADTIGFVEGGAEAMRIDSSGRVGIGTTSPNVKLQIAGDAVNTIGASYGTNIYYDAGAATNKYIANGYGGVLTVAESGAGGFRFYTAPSNSGGAGANATITERARITSAGDLLVGTTNATGDGKGIEIRPDTLNGGYIAIKKTSVVNGNTYVIFTNTGSNIGTITANGTTAVAYNTSSDYRLKENIQPMQNALGVVAQLNPVTYTWKADGSAGQGFIAHELQAVVPDAVTGEKDAVEIYTDEEGNEQTRIKPQGVDTSFLVATLTAAIQELKAELDEAKARIAALEAVPGNE